MSQGSDDHMAFISQPYPGACTHQIAPQQGEAKRRRRRKRVKSEEGSMKRKLSAEQVSLLELSFGSERKLESERKNRLASDLGLDPRQVAVWFQNRRARWKTKRLEEEYYKLKSTHDDVVLHKCWLESQVLELKEQLAEADREIRRLSVAEVAGNSPSSSQSVDVTSVHEQQIFGNGLGMDEFEDVLYMPAQDYIYCCDLWI